LGLSAAASKAADGEAPEREAASPQAPECAAGDAFCHNRRIGRGVNLGNALEAEDEGRWGLVLHEEYFRIIREASFDSVRIPIRWSAQASKRYPYTIDESFFERVDWAISQALDHGLVPIVDLHHYPELMQDPGSQKERFLALWRQIAERYRNWPDRLYFEILNEPQGNLSAGLWNVYLREALQVIRSTNPHRPVVVGAAHYSEVGQLEQLELPKEDRDLIVAFHYYKPFAFTHQGAPWLADSGPWVGTTWEGTTAEREAVVRDFDRAAAWARRNDRPLTLGEFGTYQRAPAEDRARWTAFVRETAEERRISWTYWEFAAGFGAYDLQQRRWTPDLLGALVPGTRQASAQVERDRETE